MTQLAPEQLHPYVWGWAALCLASYVFFRFAPAPIKKAAAPWVFAVGALFFFGLANLFFGFADFRFWFMVLLGSGAAVYGMLTTKICGRCSRVERTRLFAKDPICGACGTKL